MNMVHDMTKEELRRAFLKDELCDSKTAKRIADNAKRRIRKEQEDEKTKKIKSAMKESLHELVQKGEITSAQAQRVHNQNLR